MLKNLYISLCDFFSSCGRWLSYRKPCFSICDFDAESVLIVERHQLERVRNGIVRYQNHLNWKRDVERINTALRLLDLLIHDNKLEARYYSVNLRNKSRFTKLDIEDKDSDFDFDPMCAELSLCPSLLRKFNALRYEVYYSKVWHLYHAFREQWLRTWWD